jgi:hypothetical protein
MVWISPGLNSGMTIARDMAVNHDLLRYPDVRELLQHWRRGQFKEPGQMRKDLGEGKHDCVSELPRGNRAGH